MRLLVVEDDPDLNRQLTTALTDAGYVVDRAFDGEEGHFLGDSEPYDAVVLDIGLPKMDGISVLEAWRRNGRAVAGRHDKKVTLRRASCSLPVHAGEPHHEAVS